MTKSILILAGPTASGKTALSLHAGARLDGEIVNADSMQIYAELPVISAQPSTAEQSAAPHHLFGVLDPAERCSVGRWTDMALAAIADIRKRGKTPILVGGTGLYFKALLDGLAPTPNIDSHVSEAVEALHRDGGVRALRAEADRVDPVASARIMGADKQRLMRVIAVARAAGRALSELQSETKPLIDPDSVMGVVIQPDREALYARIEARFDQMIDANVLDEARAIAARNLDADLPALKAVGLPPLLSHLAGEITLDEAVETAKRDSRRYAKRQYTWFSNQHGGWPRITALDPEDQQVELEHILTEAFSEVAR